MKKLIFIFAIVLLFLVGCGSDNYLETTSALAATPDETAESEEDSSVPKAGDTVFIQLSGRVLKPGVYELPSGSRLYEAIELAGGFLEDAAEEINQVQIVSDGQIYHIPTQQEYLEEKTRQQSEDDGLIDLNLATVADLCQLPGIGESKANQIISYRDSIGGFASKEDLMQVPGIKEGTYSKLENSIIVR